MKKLKSQTGPSLFSPASLENLTDVIGNHDVCMSKHVSHGVQVEITGRTCNSFLLLCELQSHNQFIRFGGSPLSHKGVTVICFCLFAYKMGPYCVTLTGLNFIRLYMSNATV